MERRAFIRSSCSTCLLMAAGYVLPGLAGCSPRYAVFKTSITDRKAIVPLSMFQQSSIQLVRPEGWYFDIAVEKRAAGNFVALLMQCTHQENQLTPDGVNGFHCSQHGSRFDMDGNVLKGPAEERLERYRTYVEKDYLVIEIPGDPV